MRGKRIGRIGMTALILVLASTLGGTAFAQHPTPTGTGCTLGFWKNHLEDWPPTGFSPAQSVTSAGFIVPAVIPGGLGAATLLQALEFPGGPGLDGAARILLRQAVAALLNAAHPAVNYPVTVAGVRALTNAALASLVRETMLTLASQFDAFNNLGCPLPLRRDH